MSEKALFPLIGQPFIILPTVDSTNNYAMAQVQSGLATHGSVYFALEQTAGKGQRGKQWLAAAGENIMMSCVIQPGPLSVSEQFILSVSIALACYDFFKLYGSAEMTRIKWPNDLYWQDRKAGGILIESNLSHQPGGRGWKYSVAGIGININQTYFDPSLKNPVSLKQITGRHWDVIALSRQLCNCLENRYSDLFTKPFSSIMDEYRSLLYKLNQPVKLRKDNIVFETVIRSVSDSGRLITEDVMEREFVLGEVDWLL